MLEMGTPRATLLLCPDIAAYAIPDVKTEIIDHHMADALRIEDLREHIAAVLPVFTRQEGISLKGPRLLLQRRLGIDLSTRKSDMRLLAEQAVEIWNANNDNPGLVPYQDLPADITDRRGFQLFTQFHDEVGFAAKWQGVWEPIRGASMQVLVAKTLAGKTAAAKINVMYGGPLKRDAQRQGGEPE